MKESFHSFPHLIPIVTLEHKKESVYGFNIFLRGSLSESESRSIKKIPLTFFKVTIYQSGAVFFSFFSFLLFLSSSEIKVER